MTKEKMFRERVQVEKIVWPSSRSSQPRRRDRFCDVDGVIKMSCRHTSTTRQTTTQTNETEAKAIIKMPQRRRVVGSFYLFLLVLIHGLFFQVAGALRQSHYVHWNTTNPIFRIDNTDHIIDEPIRTISKRMSSTASARRSTTPAGSPIPIRELLPFATSPMN